MSDAASFDAIMQCNLLEVFCEALDAAIFVTDKLDELCFASVRLMHLFPISPNTITPGTRARDFYGALYDAGCRFGTSGGRKDKKREDWIDERVASAWRERVDAIEPSGSDRWFRIVSRRFSSGLGLNVIQDVSDHKRKEIQWRIEHERVRMTEEILDTMPVAVAVKDRNLNFAAVNQQFCKMMKVAPDAVLGRNVWDLFEPSLAAALEQADWHLLATGEDRETIINVDRPDAGPANFLHRARRVGKAANHYISMSFDELPADMSTAIKVSALKLDAGGAGAAARGETGSTGTVSPVVSGEKRRRVVHVCADRPDVALISRAASQGVELCIIHSEAEFSAFLPAIKKAGIALDLVVIEANADSVFAALSAAHGIRHLTLSPGADVLEAMADAFRRRSRSQLSVVAATDTAAPGTLAKATEVDILAVEDNPVNRMVIEQILESLGLNFLVVANGSDALDRIGGCKPKIMLADISLPDMDIAAFMSRLDLIAAKTGLAVPVVGLIATDCADQRLACRKAGLVDTLVKPLSPESIDRMLRKHLLHAASSPSASPKDAA